MVSLVCDQQSVLLSDETNENLKKQKKETSGIDDKKTDQVIKVIFNAFTSRKDLPNDRQSRRAVRNHNQEILDHEIANFIAESPDYEEFCFRQAFVEQSKRQLRAKEHLKTKIYLKEIQKNLKNLENDLQLGIKKISGVVNISIEKTAQDADRMMEQLIQEEQKSKKTASNKTKNKATNHKKKTVAQKKISLPDKQRTVISTSENSSASLEARLSKFALPILHNICFEHPRVKRWRTEDPQAIRQFEDKDSNNNTIYRYLNLNDQQISEQRFRHFLPGTERLLKDPIYREIYAFRTDRGFGFIAQLSYHEKHHNGILYFGVNKSHYVFHKYFEDVTFKFCEKKDLLRDKEVVDFKKNEKEEKEEKEEKWESENLFLFDISQDGVLKFKYSEHTLLIHPIRKDIFDRKIVSLK
jgi:hypothetical protein